jgi:hypothetical protein
MRQATFAGVGFERFGKTTRRAAFLAEMDQVVPWKDLCKGRASFGRPVLGGARATMPRSRFPGAPMPWVRRREWPWPPRTGPSPAKPHLRPPPPENRDDSPEETAG